jgi:hypothetical protein
LLGSTLLASRFWAAARSTQSRTCGAAQPPTTSSAACHDIFLTRWRSCQRTHAYITRRRAEGKTDPEIRRCLKRYIARELYRRLNTTMTT